MSHPSCIEIGPECSVTIHHCHITSQASGEFYTFRPLVFTLRSGVVAGVLITKRSLMKNILGGSAVYIHGQNARPRVISCAIIDCENVGISIDKNAQVLKLQMYCVSVP